MERKKNQRLAGEEVGILLERMASDVSGYRKAKNSYRFALDVINRLQDKFQSETDSDTSTDGHIREADLFRAINFRRLLKNPCSVSGSISKQIKEREGGDAVSASSTPSDADLRREIGPFENLVNRKKPQRLRIIFTFPFVRMRCI